MNEIVKRPSADDVRTAISEFKGWDDEPDPALKLLFEQYPKNCEFDHVLLKVVALNALYSTMIRVNSNQTPTVYDVARHIVALNIDEALGRGDEGLVERIAKVSVGSRRQRNYSFATKYCNWHRQELFPIYDSRADTCLWHLRSIGRIKGFNRQDLYYSYPKFKAVVKEFRDSLGEARFNYKEIDIYLYMKGRELFDKKRNKKLT
jgi:hypothetical protein